MSHNRSADLDIATIAVYLVLAHLLADYAFQPDFMAKAKNHTAPISKVPWSTILVSHAAIHAGLVYAVTGNAALASIELAGHSAIDYAKCGGRISFNQDQALHLLMKAGYVAWLW